MTVEGETAPVTQTDLGETTTTQKLSTYDPNYVAPGIAQRVEQKRALEAKRRERILNAKVRTIGVDKSALDAQVEEKRLKAEAELQENAVDDAVVAEVTNHLKLVEISRQQQVAAVNMECRLINQNTEKKPDPYSLKSTELVPESEAGVSALRTFAGEDREKAQRVKMQAAQQRNWLQQQIYEKRVANANEKDMEANFNAELSDVVAVRTEVERKNNELRSEITRENLQFVIDQRTETEEKRKAFKAAESDLERQEMEFHAQDDLLNQKTPQYNENGRLRIDHFLGKTKDIYYDTRESQKVQIEEKATLENAEKETDFYEDAAQEETRRQLVAMEEERSRQHRQSTRDTVFANDPKKKPNRPIMGEVSEEFFDYFGRSTR